jgi:alpha-beta hydrolase superfamily lysophospholipase
MSQMKTDGSNNSQPSPLIVHSADNHEIFVHSWANINAARAVLLIAHGMAEHGARYASLASFLNVHGIVVYAIDHRGHGKSAANPEKLGHFTINSEANGWEQLIADLHTVVMHLSSTYPGIPLVLLGHSMGSFISLGYAIRHGNILNGLILSGSNSNSIITCHIARAITKMETFRQGALGKSNLLYALSFSSFNKKFQPARTDFDWLSRDPEQVDQYINDIKCGFKLGNKSWFDLLGGLIEISRRSNLSRIPANLPIFIFGGDHDPVGGFGKGLHLLMKELQASGIRELKFKLYSDGRHEMLNEINRAEVYHDIIKWLDNAIA